MLHVILQYVLVGPIPPRWHLHFFGHLHSHFVTSAFTLSPSNSHVQHPTFFVQNFCVMDGFPRSAFSATAIGEWANSSCQPQNIQKFLTANKFFNSPHGLQAECLPEQLQQGTGWPMTGKSSFWSSLCCLVSKV